MRRVTGHVKVVQRNRGPVFYLKYRLPDGRQVQTLLGPKWTDRGRPPAGYFTDRTAQEALQELLADARRGTLAGAEVRTGKTFDDACQEWLRYVRDDKQISASTLTDYRNVVTGYLLPEFGASTPLENITTERIDAYREELLAEGRLSRRTIRKVLVCVHGVLKRAKRRKWIASNPAEDAERVTVPFRDARDSGRSIVALNPCRLAPPNSSRKSWHLSGAPLRDKRQRLRVAHRRPLLVPSGRLLGVDRDACLHIGAGAPVTSGLRSAPRSRMPRSCWAPSGARSARFYGGELRPCSDVDVKRAADDSSMLGRALIGLAATGLPVFGIARYRRDLRRDQERVAKFEPSVIDTLFGRVEYAQVGDGPPVMVVHGVLGGFDFGVGVGRVNVPPGYRVISPSRFGFFGSPLPPDPSPAAQADAFAALLDYLNIVELPVVAFSAGSSSAVQLALRHPERVSRLVLISPNSPHPEPLPKPPRMLAPILFSQPVFWAMRLLARSRLEGMSGTPAGFVPDERERAALREIVDGLFPVGPRARGTIYDGYIGNVDIAAYPFESLTVPTLVVAAEDDTLAPYKDSRAMAERIPRARLVTVRRGGHALTQLDAGARRAVADFIGAAGRPVAPESPVLAEGG